MIRKFIMGIIGEKEEKKEEKEVRGLKPAWAH
jgi:hypothetical protein